MREALRLIRDGAAADAVAMPAAIAQAHHHLAAAAGEFGEVALHIATNRITVQDDVVYKSEARDNNLAFDLFRQGLRRITFRAGLSVEEVDAFIRSLAQTRDVSASDIDFVGTLWQEELEHIEYVAIDGFTEKLFMSEQRFTALFRGAIEDVMPGLLEIDEDDVGDRKRRQYTPADAFDALEAGEGIEAQTLKQAQAEADALNARLQAALSDAALDHLARLLATVCVKDPQALTVEQLGEMITRLIDAYAERGAWQRWATCARSFWQLCDQSSAFAAPVQARLDALAPAVAGMPMLAAFLERLAEAPRDAQSWLRWFVVQGKALSAPDLLQGMKTCTDPVAAAYLKDLLHRQGTASLGPWAERLNDPDPVVVLEVLDVILSSPLAAQARPVLIDCLGNDSPAVRARAVQGMASGYDLTVREAILPFLRDPDSGVRQAVVRVMGAARDRSVAPYIAQLIKSSGFGGFDEDEQRLHFETLARLGGEAFFKVFEARLRMDGDGNAITRLFNRGPVVLTDDPLRRSALAGLARLRTPEAIALIRAAQARADLTLAGHCDVVLRLAARDAPDKSGAAPPPAGPSDDDLRGADTLLGPAGAVLFQIAELRVAAPVRPMPDGSAPLPPTAAEPVALVATPDDSDLPLAERPLLGAHERFEADDHRALTASPTMSQGSRFRLTSPRATVVAAPVDEPEAPATSGEAVMIPAPIVEAATSVEAPVTPSVELPAVSIEDLEASMEALLASMEAPAPEPPPAPEPAPSPAPAPSVEDLLRGYLSTGGPAPVAPEPGPEPVRPAPEPVRPTPEPVRPAPEPVRPAPADVDALLKDFLDFDLGD